MTIRAYDESYLATAQSILGHATDFAVMTLDIGPDAFGSAFAVSSVSKQFAAGNPSYVAGMNGCELVRAVLSETHISFVDAEDSMYIDRSPEFWAGWALAFYQWYSSRQFMEILSAVKLSEIIQMYTVYHEMDIIHFADRMDEIMRQANPSTRLKTRRANCNMSQSQLAKDADVPLRQIQLFEQRQRNINNASAITLLKLSRSLNCRIEDLIEY